MTKVRLFLLLAVVIACSGSACPKKIKTTSLIVHANNTASTGTSEGGKMVWVSETQDGKPFKVHIYGENPCTGTGASNDIPGRPGSPAVCTLASGTDGTYAYAILAPDEGPATPGITILYFHTDVCKACEILIQIKKKAKHPTIDLPSTKVASNPPIVPIACFNMKTATADPPLLKVYAGQLILWTQIGKNESSGWSAIMPANVCSNGDPNKATTFGTISPTTRLGCIVGSGLAIGKIYGYDIHYFNDSIKDCKGTASLLIDNPPTTVAAQ